jgi:hypothetical protein
MVVTGDAMHTQRDLSIQIVEQGGDYLWTVKENQPTLRDDLELLFDRELVAFAGGGGSTGRLDRPTCRESAWASGRTHDHGEQSAARLERLAVSGAGVSAGLLPHGTDMVTGETSSEVRYGITSQPPEVAGPRTLLAQVRGEWGIETWVCQSGAGPPGLEVHDQQMPVFPGVLLVNIRFCMRHGVG